jgi:hypothetical protein
MAAGAEGLAGAGVAPAFGGGAPEVAAAAVAGLTWTDLGLCGARIGSTGQGVFGAVDRSGGRAALQGAALLDATLFGVDAGGGFPAEIGGVMVIQGDAGALSGVFIATRTE